MKDIKLYLFNNGDERVESDITLNENENKSTELKISFPEILKGKYISIDFILSDESIFKTPLVLTTETIYLYELSQNICTGTVYFQVCFTSTGFIQKSKKYVIQFSDSINATETIAETGEDVLTSMELRITAVEESNATFIEDNETSITIGTVGETDDTPSVENVGTAKDQIWNFLLKSGNGISEIRLISTVGLVKTYRMTFTDNTTFEFTVTDGAKGEEGSTGNLIQVTGISLLAVNWSLVSGLYEISYANENITVNSVVDLIIDKSSILTAQAADVQYYTESSAGSVKLFSKYLPTDTIMVIMNIYTKS